VSLRLGILRHPFVSLYLRKYCCATDEKLRICK